MKNSFCEDANVKIDVKTFHEEEMAKMGIPKWANVDCPFCHDKLPLRSIRGVTMKFNARNIGDLGVEVFCDKCSLMDTVYFRKEFKGMDDVVSILTGKKEPLSQPIIEENMYKMQYNNLVENMVIGGERNVNI